MRLTTHLTAILAGGSGKPRNAPLNPLAADAMTDLTIDSASGRIRGHPDGSFAEGPDQKNQPMLTLAPT